MAAKLANLPLGGAGYRSANLQTDGVSQAQAAQLLNVSTRSVAAAAKVLHQGDPSLIEAVQRGEVAVSTAVGAATPAG